MAAAAGATGAAPVGVGATAAGAPVSVAATAASAAATEALVTAVGKCGQRVATGSSHG